MRLCNIHAAFLAEEEDRVYCNVVDYRQFQRLNKHFDSTVIIARKTSRTDNLVLLDLPGVEVHLTNSITSPIDFIRHLRKVRNIIEYHLDACDIVYSTLGPMTMIAHKLAQKKGKKTILFLGGDILDSLKLTGGIYRKSVAHYAFKRVKKLVERIDHVIYVARYLRDTYPTSGKWCLWSDVYFPDITEEQMANRRSSIINKGKPTKVGLIGYTHNNVKGIDTAIKALALLNKDFHLEILGGGDQTWANKIVDKLSVRERIRFHGVVQGGAPVLKWLDNIDVYIQPSRTEGLPKATLEAMSRGCPVISSNVGGLPDIVMREWLHKPGDYRTLAQLIQQLSSNKHNMLVSSDHSYSVASRYSKGKLDEIFDDFIDQITRDLR